MIRLLIAATLSCFAASFSFAGLNEGFAAAKAGNFARALKEWKPLAEQGNAGAQYYLGVMYANGNGVPQDYKQAAAWYRKAAEQGEADAQNNLGRMYHSGQGVGQDYAQAAAWHRKAAEQGNAYALRNLALSYATGQGVVQDVVLAYVLFNLSATEGNEDAVNDRKVAVSLLSARQLEEGQALSRAWQRGTPLPTTSRYGVVR